MPIAARSSHQFLTKASTDLCVQGNLWLGLFLQHPETTLKLLQSGHFWNFPQHDLTSRYHLQSTTLFTLEKAYSVFSILEMLTTASSASAETGRKSYIMMYLSSEKNFLASIEKVEDVEE
eukprot:s2230_g7.t1